MTTVCDISGCSLKCTKAECGCLCRHMYKCECYDYANGHICKHTHAVQATEHIISYAQEMEEHSPVISVRSGKENTVPGKENDYNVHKSPYHLYRSKSTTDGESSASGKTKLSPSFTPPANRLAGKGKEVY